MTRGDLYSIQKVLRDELIIDWKKGDLKKQLKNPCPHFERMCVLDWNKK